MLCLQSGPCCGILDLGFASTEIQEAERTLRLHVQAQQSLAQGSILGSEQDDEKAKSQGHVKSRQQRQSPLSSAHMHPR
eukprot:1865823-Rhodomonas_salina.1